MLTSVENTNDFMNGDAKEGIRRVEAFKEFESVYHSSYPSKALSCFQSSYLTERSNQVTGIVCFNSAWRSYDSETDRGSLIVGENQVQKGIAFTKDCQLRIGLIHHPTDWLIDFDENVIQNLLQKHFHLVFCGHIHRNSSWKQAGLYGNIFVSVAPPNWVTAARELNLADCNGYSIVDIDFSKLELIVHHRRYSASKKKYVANNELGDNEGISVYQLPTTTESTQRHEELSIANTIRTRHFDELNEHLLSYNSDSRAPKDLLSLFVLPRIVERVEVDAEKEQKQKPLSIIDLCSSDDSLILLGVKEAGKTTLLHRLLIEFTNNIEKYIRIPIFIDFLEIGNRKIETMVARFLGVGATATESLIREHKLVILLDNLSLDKPHQFSLQRLSKFLEIYTGCRVIATVNQSFEGFVPPEIFESEKFYPIMRLTVKTFGTKEIRELMEKWFASNEQFNKADKLDNLVSVILSLNLPRTPLAVSMFLWILEQHHNYQPVNQATMLENFIEKLFVKHSRKEIYSDRFDFKNKQQLLAEIAHFMLSKNQENYRVRLRELMDFVDDHIRGRKFEDFINAQDVVDHFIDKGILQREFDNSDTFIRFRFTCLFQYFVMKKMEFDAAFRESVLKEENFLRFENEIDYYTGVKRDQTDILKLLVDRMTTAYEAVLSTIRQLPKSFDSVFGSDQSLIKSLDESFITRLTESKKPSQAEIDEISDAALEKIPVEKGIQKKPTELSERMRMERLWSLAARVLRNTEETREENLKYESYVAILHCSLAYAVLWKVHIERFISIRKEKDPDFHVDLEIEFQRKILPLIHEMVLSSLLGTKKLSVVLREKIVDDFKNLALSDFERFVTPFLCADLEAKDFEVHLRKLIKRMNHAHLLDMVLIKLVAYYFLRSKSRETDHMYENLIGDVITRAKGLPRSKKAAIIREYRSKKKLETTKKKNGGRKDN